MNRPSMIPGMARGVAVTCMLLISGTALAMSAGGSCKAHAQAALKAFTQNRFGRVNRHFAPDVAGRATQEAMQAAWKQLESKEGSFRHLGKLASRNLGGRTVLVAPLAFANGKLNGLVVCNADNQITGFRFVPASMLPAASSGTSRSKPAPRSKHVPGVVSTAVDVPSPLGPLPGRLALPEGAGPFPAVVFAAGSGPGDMDETIGPNKPFRDIAVGLARQGVASLRFDKRAHVYPEQMAGKPITVDDEETNDVLSALNVLARQKGIDAGRLFVVGLSEGAMLAPRIARKAGDLAGIVMLAAPARPLLEVMAGQYRARGASGVISEADAAAKVKAINAERTLLAGADPARPSEGTFMHAPQSWWLSMRDYHAAQTAREMGLPMLIVQGGKDIQVSPTKDFARWKNVLGDKPNVTFHLYPGLTHLFIPGQGTLADYRKPGHVSTQVIQDIDTWIKAQPAR